MTNYICINGQKAELTEAQLKDLGIELPKKNPFERATEFKPYYSINSRGKVESFVETFASYDDDMSNVANYCTDKSIMEQRALHETLNRLLWRYSMEHDGDKIDWENRKSEKYFIYYDYVTKHFQLDYRTHCCHIGPTYFRTKKIARNAIEEIVKPFMEAHPEFVW